MDKTNRATAREIANKHLNSGDSLGWFEELYATAGDDTSIIPWADLIPNPNLVDWLDQNNTLNFSLALKVGCGLGDDAEELARRGFKTTAFDISKSAIDISRKRFPGSPVSYVAADLFSTPKDWQYKFDFVLESYTLQVLPPDLRVNAIEYIANFVAPGGILLVIARAREPEDPIGNMPWPLTKEELSLFRLYKLQEISFEDYIDTEDPPVRRFRVTYSKLK
jgi:SAM-dependent methyltransferase